MPLLEGYRLSTQCMDHPLVSVGLYHVSYTLQAGYTVFPIQQLFNTRCRRVCCGQSEESEVSTEAGGKPLPENCIVIFANG